jgi:DcmR-like sensory protein
LSWSRFIDSASAAEHAVQVYEGSDDLVATVVPYLAGGSPALVIATPEHARAFLAALPDGCDVVVLDAEEILDAICEDGSVSPEAFERVVGGAVDELLARAPGSTVRAFGEMVDVLWQRGARDEALALERLWNDLQRSRPVALLCAYCADVFDVDSQSGLEAVFGLHTHARPVADTARLSAALDQALTDAVGPARAARIYLDVADQVPRGRFPRAQAVIGWLCANDRAKAADVLARARKYYA